MKVVIVSASTRTGRLTQSAALGLYNILQTKPDLIPQILDLKEEALPMFEETMNKLSPTSDSVNKIHTILDSADAFLFVTPEYNGSYSSALKNMVDIYPKSTFANKAVGLVTITSGNLGGMRAAIQLQLLTLAIWAIPCPEMLLVSNVQNKFSENGELREEGYAKNIHYFLTEFLWLGNALKNAKS